MVRQGMGCEVMRYVYEEIEIRIESSAVENTSYLPDDTRILNEKRQETRNIFLER
jgi:hypothetical protein